MQIRFAHLRERSTSGGWIDFAVFSAKPIDGNYSAALAELTARATNAGCKIDQSALMYNDCGRVRFYGDKNLVDYLSKRGCPVLNKTLTF